MNPGFMRLHFKLNGVEGKITKYWMKFIGFKKKYSGNVRIMVWGIIRSSGPMDIVFIDGKEDSEVYIDVLKMCKESLDIIKE
jgi:hypothetical protein